MCRRSGLNAQQDAVWKIEFFNLPLRVQNHNKMQVIPQSERAAATATLNEVRQWLGAADYREIAKDLKTLTEGTVRQVAKGERFNMDAYTKLLQLGRAKAAAFASTLAGQVGTTPKPTRTVNEPTKPRKTAEIAPVADTIAFNAKPAPKRSTKRKAVAVNDDSPTA